MIFREQQDGFVSQQGLDDAVREYFGRHDCGGKRILFLIPDNTRSGPIGQVFQSIFEMIGQEVAAIDCLVALGTHRPMSEQEICERLSMDMKVRRSTYKKVNFFNHRWDKPETFKTIGQISADEIEQLSEGRFRESIDVRINKLIFDYDEFFILGPVFPHEVVGFSGGHKYIFPGIAGAEIIDFFHWLGAVITNPVINGNIWTPTRAVVEKAASFIDHPHQLIAVVSAGQDLKGIFLGDCGDAWQAAAELSQKCHIVYKDRAYHLVIGIAPQMYDDIWVAGKAMYKLEPVVADGGTLVIYAPHIQDISYAHGKAIKQIGYHVRDYFLKQPEKFKNTSRAVMAHSTHVKGIGTFEDGIEKPRIQVALATGISKATCQQINLGYRDFRQIDISGYRNREKEGILVVDHAGETLYRLADGTIPKVT